MKRVDDIELEEDLAFERRARRWQRAGQAVLVALAVAALAGVFGHGAAARARATDTTGGLNIEYPRFARRLAPCELTLEAAPGLGRDGELRVWFDRSFAEHFEWEKAWPEPSGMEMQLGRIVVSFRLPAAADPARVLCRLKPGRAGPGRLEAGIVDGPSVTLSYFIYP